MLKTEMDYEEQARIIPMEAARKKSCGGGLGLKKELVAVSLSMFRRTISAHQSPKKLADDILFSVYIENRERTETFDEWKREVLVLIGDTLYNYNDIVFSRKLGRKLILHGDTTQADKDGVAFAKAFQECNVQNLRRWAEHLEWGLYKKLRKLTDSHLENTPAAKKSMEERAKQHYFARTGNSIEDANPRLFWKNVVLFVQHQGLHWANFVRANWSRNNATKEHACGGNKPNVSTKEARENKPNVSTKEAQQAILGTQTEFIKEEGVLHRFGVEWCTKSAVIWHPVLDASSESLGSGNAEVFRHMRQTPYDSWEPADVRDVVLRKPVPKYIAPRECENGPGGFVYILNSKHHTPTLSPSSCIDQVAVRRFDILFEQMTAKGGCRHAMLYFHAAGHDQKYCVQLNPLSFLRKRLEDEKVWDGMMADLKCTTMDHSKISLITITDDPELTKNDSLGHYDFEPEREVVETRGGTTVADLVKCAEEWVRKNPAYVLNNADCRHFAHAAYDELKQ